MSGLEDRCIQFHEAALGTGKSKGAAKEIAVLRRFLHKNQTQRFTDKATSRLFDTIQLYSTISSSSSKLSVSLEDKEGLLEDALKMPFTVFSTKQKKTMLKWIEDVRGENNSKATSGSISSNTPVVKLSVIDCDTDNKCLSLMQDETGDTYEDVALPDGELGDQIVAAFQNTDETLELQAELLNNHTVRIKTLLPGSSS